MILHKTARGHDIVCTIDYGSYALLNFAITIKLGIHEEALMTPSTGASLLEKA